ncbi:MAG TPA: flagellin [Phycisphaerae bacterium]|nr:flagellin [Phycisphaerae bacterium]
MSISVGNLSRVSNSLRTFTALTQLQRNSLRVFQQEQRISTGQQLLSVGDDPVAAEKIVRLTKSGDTQNQILADLQHADDYLSASDNALTQISDLLIDAARIASEQAGSFQSAEERASQSVVIDGIIDQLMNVGNTKYQGIYLFGGQGVTQAPLNSAFGRITAVGDTGQRQTLVDPGCAQAFNVIAADVFGLRENVTGGYAHFNVQLAGGTRLSELNGANGAGVRLGRMSVTEGAVSFEVDLTGADTIDGVIAKFNDAASAAGSTLTLGINPADGATLRVTNGGSGPVQIQDLGQGTAAADLGIKKSAAAGANIDGDNLHRRMTLTTALADLGAGGITLPSGVVITNGERSGTVTFTGATTVQDVLNRLNASGVGIRASINSAADGIEIQNLVAGTALIVGENGGTDAETLGIRALDDSVPLSRLNGLRGIHPVEGTDIKITNANGVSFEVDLSNAQTVGDVINAIQSASAAAGAGISVTTSSGGAGLRLTGPAGAGTITVESVNMSPVAAELGIEGSGSATVLDGDNVGAAYQTGLFSALYRLRDALQADDSSEITEAGSQINDIQQQIAATRGDVGAKSRSLNARLDQTQQAVDATQILLSKLKDTDFTEAVTRFQEAQTALQASLMTGSKTLSLSLLDFLQ